MTTQLTPPSLAKTLHWVLSLTWAGRDWYWSTDRVTITRDDGTTIQTEGGLSVTFRQVLALMGRDESAIPEVTVGPLVLDAYPEIDLPTEIEAGRLVSGSSASLSLWAEGETWEAREVKLVGRAYMSQYGTTAEGLSFVLRPDRADAGALPPFRMRAEGALSTEDVIKGYAFDNPNAAGLVASFVFGAPGVAGDESDVAIRGGSPGIGQNLTTSDMTIDMLIIAQHHVVASSVEVVNLSIPGIATGLGVIESTDPDGYPYSAVILGGATSTPRPGNQGFGSHVDDDLWVNWAGSGGGIASRYYPGKSLRGGGELSIAMLERGRIRYDAARWEAVRPLLDVYLFDGYIDEQVRSLEWLRTVLWPLLPVAIAYGNDGLYPVVWRPGRGNQDALRHLYATDDGGSLVRVSDVLEQDDHLMNQLELAYRPRSDGKGYSGRLVLTGQERKPPPSYATGVSTTDARLHLRRSVNQYGVHIGKVIESDIIYSEQTAHLVLGWQSALYGSPWRQITYALERADAALQAGDEVLITDSEIGLSARKAWVSMVEWRDLEPAVSLVLLPEVS